MRGSAPSARSRRAASKRGVPDLSVGVRPSLAASIGPLKTELYYHGLLPREEAEVR